MTFQERFKYNTISDLIGKGGFARVYKATDTLLDREVAIKVFNATDKGQYTVLEEIKKAIKLQHPNLLRYYDVAVVENTNALGETETLQIGVMELANAGDLKQFAKNNPNSPKLFALLQQVLSGLEYLHQKGIIHRDLKPQNILLVEEDGELTAKISDFGISKSLDSGTNSSSMAIGTIEYMAPEQFNPAKYGINGKIGTNVDLWSFGIMVHELLTNEPLFGQRSGNTTSEQIMNAILSSELPEDVELLKEPYKTIVKKCLITDARQRIQKANQIIHLLDDIQDSSDSVTEELDTELLKKMNQKTTNQTKDKDSVLKEESIEKPKGEMNHSTTPNKKSSLKYLLIGGILLLLVLGSWYFIKSNSKADEEYHLALKYQKEENYNEYFNHLKNAALLDKDSANWMIARIYSIQGEYKEAWPYIDRLVKPSDSEPDFHLPQSAVMYAKNLIIGKNNLGEGIKILTQQANNGDPDCAFELGMLYYEGKKNIQQSYDTSLKYFKLAANKGNNKALCMLGNMYFMGTGVPQDFTAAIEYYYKAAEKENPVAMYALGLAFSNGKGVNQNNEEAVKWFRKVVNKKFLDDNEYSDKAADNFEHTKEAAQKMIETLP
jgi:serine/threonine protein kinase